jgi:hypothetical protein
MEQWKKLVLKALPFTIIDGKLGKIKFYVDAYMMTRFQ